MTRIFTCCTIFLFVLSSKLNAQQALPVGMTPAEQNLMPSYLQQIQPAGIPLPPASPVRTMAEWEEIQALTITWTSYASTLRQIVAAAQTETQVYIICTDSNTVKSYLTTNNIPLTNLHYVQAPYNSVWMRDYGQNTAYTNDVDSLILVDWIYNRPRPKDDTIPSVLAREFGIPLYETTMAPYDLIHTGGNFMSDGFGTAFSSELVLDENPSKTNDQIDSIMSWFMGIDRYILMPTLPYDGIHHIDMHMKLLDEETILVGQYPQGVSDGPQIEANLQFVLSNFNSVYGTPYKVVRIPQPPDNNGDYPNQGGDYCTYSNAVFVNKTVILPLYYMQYDTTALRIWQEALPGYRIVGINCNTIIQASGAIHCITHSIGVADPLLISHQELPNTTNTITPYQVDALVKHRSGIQTATLFWSIDTSQAWNQVTMNLTNATTDTWTGYIPAQAAGTTVYYYVQGQSVSGKVQVRPMPAPQGFWQFDVTGFVAVAEQHTEIEFLPVYPNPSHGITCIPLVCPEEITGRLVLLDMTGREVMVISEGRFAAGSKNYFFNSLGMAAGVYQIVLQTENGNQVQKLMVR